MIYITYIIDIMFTYYAICNVFYSLQLLYFLLILAYINYEKVAEINWIEYQNHQSRFSHSHALTLIPLGGGGAFSGPPPVVFFAVHLDRLEFHVQTSWLFSLKSPAYFDI